MNKGITAVILAGGLGARLRPYTTVLPKPLMPISEMPILDIVIRQLVKARVRRIVLSVGYLSELIEAYCGNGERYGVELTYVRESRPLGTVGPLSLIDDLNDTFLLINGDILTDLDFSRVIRYHRRKKADMTIAVKNREVSINFGVVSSNRDGKILKYREKPKLHYEIGMGVAVMEPVVLKYIPRNRRLDVPDLIRKLIRNRGRVYRFKSDSYWRDIGIPDDYAAAVEEFEAYRSKLVGGRKK